MTPYTAIPKQIIFNVHTKHVHTFSLMRFILKVFTRKRNKQKNKESEYDHNINHWIGVCAVHNFNNTQLL